MKKLLITQVAGLSMELAHRIAPKGMDGHEWQAAQSVFPAVTCTAQATFRTAAPPARHGMIANGLYHRSLCKPMFWEQSARQVEGPRIWDAFREKGGRTGLLFWQQSLGEDVDMVLSPAPIHKHHGGMIQAVCEKPDGLYDRCCRTLGRRFSLHHYWGPAASPRSSQWIADATCALLYNRKDAPELCLTYLPALDYDAQRFGPRHERVLRVCEGMAEQIRQLRRAAEDNGYDWLFFGDYAIGPVSGGAVLPNLALRQDGLLDTRSVRSMSYPLLYSSRAFAMVDHEVAHVYIPHADDVPTVRRLMESLDGVERVLDRAAQQDAGIAHANAGELVLIAAPGRWFAYPWWTEKSEAPDFAGHVDIHNKPGFDPCELFWGWPPGSVSTNTERIGGSHGRIGPDREIAWLSNAVHSAAPDLVTLARETQQWLTA